MLHPFFLVTYPNRWYLLVLLTVATAGFAYILWCQGEPLKAATPHGILAYEFSWTKQGAQAILDSWKKPFDVAREQLQVDYAFLVFYPLLLSLTCGILADSPDSVLAEVGIFISWAVLLSGPLDAVENYALLVMIQSGASEAMAKTAGWCAGMKFTLVFAALGYCLCEGINLLFRSIKTALLD